MKKEKYRSYVSFGVTGFLMIAACLLFFFVLYRFGAIYGWVKSVVRILEPFTVGLVIAYLLAPLFNLLVRNLRSLFLRKLKQRPARILAMAISLTACIVVALVVIFGLLALVVPRFIKSIIGIVNSLETYSDNLMKWIAGLLAGNAELASRFQGSYENVSDAILGWINETIVPAINSVFSDTSSLSALFSGVVTGVRLAARLVSDFILGFIVAAYLLVSKNKLIGQAKKIIYSLFKLDHANYLLKEGRYVLNVFGGFIRGKLVDSLIMGVLCFIGCFLLKIPVPLVVAVIVGCTNIIPFFGPFIGAIPCAALILLISPIKCLYFCIFILILQQFDGNVLGPKILGNTTGLSAFWVLFSIVLFGGLFGFVGMIIAVPLFAVIYSFISDYVNHRLKKKKLPLDTDLYEHLERVEPEDAAFVHMKDPTRK